MKKYLITYAIASVFALGAITAQAAQQFWVTKTTDSFDEVCDKNGVCNVVCDKKSCSLRDAIQAANNNKQGNNTIRFLQGGTYLIQITGDDEKGEKGDYDLWSRIEIDGRALDGQKVTIDAQHLDRVFDIHADAYVYLNGLTIINGERPYYFNPINEKFGAGAGVKNVGTLFMNDCELAFNEGGNLASAFYNGEGGQAVVTESRFVFNQSLRKWGSPIYSGDHISELPKSITRLIISDSLISSNSGGELVGSGGINIENSDFELFRSHVIKNTSLSEAGGIYIYAENPAATVLHIQDSDISANQGGEVGGIESTIVNKGAPGGPELSISGSTISNNEGWNGGGIFTSGPTKIVNSTISGNLSKNKGGGLFNFHENTGTGHENIEDAYKMQLNNVTITNNLAQNEGGGIYGSAVLQNTIVSDNVDSGVAPDCSQTMISRDYNLISNLQGCQLNGATANSILGVSARLGSLRNNGGFGFTHALLTTSLGINAGNDATCEATDQRGVARPQFQRCDMGAYERTTSPSSND